MTYQRIISGETMSAMLGQVLGGMLGEGQGGQPSPLVGVLQQVLASQGGVAGVVSRFQAVGLGTQAQSWVGTGQNASISADHVAQAFTPDQLQAWAQQAGTTPDVLAQAIPHVVDHLTPEGQVPAQPAAQQPDLSMLVGRLLGGGGTPRPN